MSSLWSNITIAIDAVRSDHQMQVLPRWLKLFLTRSLDHPLTIFIRDTDPVIPPNPLYSFRTTISTGSSTSAARTKTRELVLRALFANSDRWFSFSFIGIIRYSCKCYTLLKGFSSLRHLDIDSSELISSNGRYLDGQTSRLAISLPILLLLTFIFSL
ncbi:hypothetical protein D9757_012809 [Collybiopsis confluens]|uniref:Uncharacterized protein n=1 Tax=Collybiopsis confluens TaxID=2823264 RepID=A0A8H5G0M0_9AGAR|nr:hypothetical protein D9757_012809 [Collybiopsis confluens]